MMASPLATTEERMNPARDFLEGFSVEITPRQVDKIATIRRSLSAGTEVYIALIDPADVPQQIEAAKALAAHGLKPVPHVPARLITDKASLEDRMRRLSGEAGVTQVLAVGGGLEPAGPFSSTIEVMRTGVFERHGIKTIGLAGHPEGNPDITKVHGEGALMEALLLKQAHASEQGLEAYLATQFLFQAEPVAIWARSLRAAGITLPIRVGIPGPATVKTLVKYALMCGVGASARMIRKQALNVTKLLTVSTPDEMVAELGRLQQEQPALKIDGAHLYPFGGFEKLFHWIEDVHSA
ncbi:methylenetetrahydrofolate reductase (NADPH) [Rhodoligotrophos appendicifer]|uniref:methylenetetrahydrofolate reductase n=1 Tax=Rhodoligotrophos appendicifer TaxID=987056 RepID=UPI0011865B80|nr:methylenetetrahydrofolate reductase [Rhodoligotrophos appendicifer]